MFDDDDDYYYYYYYFIIIIGKEPRLSFRLVPDYSFFAWQSVTRCFPAFCFSIPHSLPTLYGEHLPEATAALFAPSPQLSTDTLFLSLRVLNMASPQPVKSNACMCSCWQFSSIKTERSLCSTKVSGGGFPTLRDLIRPLWMPQSPDTIVINHLGILLWDTLFHPAFWLLRYSIQYIEP